MGANLSQKVGTYQSEMFLFYEGHNKWLELLIRKLEKKGIVAGINSK